MSFMVGIEVTRRCNFRCRHCYVDAGRARAREATTAEIESLLPVLKGFGTDVVAWSGGEPLLRPDLEQLTQAAVRLGMQTGLVSNGYLATAERMQSLRRAGLDVAQISLDGSTPRKAHRLRQGPEDAFARASAAVRNSVAAGIQTYVCALFTPQTAPEVLDMIHVSRDLGAHGLRYTIWTPVGRAEGHGYDEREWASPTVRRFLDVLGREDSPAFRVLIDCPTGPLPSRPTMRCTAGTHTAYITADGNVYPCTALMAPAYRVGNWHRTPLGNLLRSPRMRAVHDQRSRLRPAGTCAGCGNWDGCHGGCPGRTVAVDGSLARGPLRGAMPACLVRLHRS
jgi:radical SAM protein with 4Fe4S-binding SPASM domain